MPSALNPSFRLVKMLDIGYVAAIYFIFAMYTSVLVDNYYGPFDREAAEQKSFIRLASEATLQVWIFGVIVYIVRNLAELIPSPFHGVAGLDHYRLKELTNAALFTIIFMLYQRNLKARIDYIYERFLKAHNVQSDAAV